MIRCRPSRFHHYHLSVAGYFPLRWCGLGSFELLDFIIDDLGQRCDEMLYNERMAGGISMSHLCARDGRVRNWKWLFHPSSLMTSSPAV